MTDPNQLKSDLSPWVYLGLGSNLENPPEQLRAGIELIKKHLQPKALEISNMVKTPPLGGKVQPDYYNLVCRFRSSDSPIRLLKAIQGIEDARGRTRQEHWGSRTLDIDLLLVGDLVFKNDDLTLPHPGIPFRSFVLAPLLELDSGLVDPVTRLTYLDYWKQLPLQDQQNLIKIT